MYPQFVLSLIAPERWFFILGALAGIIYALTTPLLAQFVLPLIFNQVLVGAHFELLPKLVLQMLGLLLLGAIGLFVQDALFSIGSARFGARVRKAVYQAFLRAKPQIDSSAGQTTRLALDVRELELFYSQELTVIVAQGLMVISAIVILLVSNLRLTLYLLLIAVPALLILARLGKRAEHASKDLQQAAESASQQMAEGLSRLDVIKTFGLEKLMLWRFAKPNEYQAKAQSKRGISIAAQSPLTQVMSGLAIVILLVLAINEVQANRLTIGQLSAYVVLISLLPAPIQMLSRTFGRFSSAREPIRQVKMALNRPAEDDFGLENPPIGGWKGEIEFREISAAYGKTLALKNLSLKIKTGESVALVGQSGAGKTTLMKVLLRLIEPKGKYFLDGEPVEKYRKSIIRQAFALVPQNPQLFFGTVAENLRLVKPNASDAQLWQTLEDVALADELRARQGLETEIGEQNSGLSGGQAQRLAIARALLSEAPIILFDEPTSALDVKAEQEIKKAIENLKGKKTIILIAHRMNIASALDRAIVLQNGEIIGDGMAKELLSQRISQLTFLV